MNASKISLPPAAILSYYFYCTYFLLFLTCLISPLLFYAVLTQSQKLKAFKWFVFNHAIWCFILELVLGLLKPVLLTPAFGGYPLGFARENGSLPKTMAYVVIGLGSGIFYIAGLSATLGTRYLTIFQSRWTSWISTKLIITLCISISSSINAVLVIVSVIIVCFTGRDAILQNAINYDSFFKDLDEPSLAFFPIEYTHTPLTIVFGIVILLIFAYILSMILFGYYTIKSSKISTTATKLQKSLIISSIVQVLLTVTFFCLPVLGMITFLIFQIEHTTIWMCLACTFLSLHSIMESIATLYFIIPYRRFVKNLFSKLFSLFYNVSKNLKINAPASSVINSTNSKINVPVSSVINTVNLKINATNK